MAVGGDDFTFIMDINDNILAAGCNSEGQLGSVEFVRSCNFQVVKSSLQGLKQIALGADHGLGLTYEGTLKCWGCASMKLFPEAESKVVCEFENSHSQSVQENLTEEDCLDYTVPGLENIAQISCSSQSCSALDEERHVWNWKPHKNPKRIEGLENICAISAGEGYLHALDVYGSVWMYGNSPGSYLKNSICLKKLDTSIRFVSVQSRGDHSIGLDDLGQVWCWGSNSEWQLGTRQSPTSREIPIKVDLPVEITQVACGYYFSLALDIHGHVWFWGMMMNSSDKWNYSLPSLVEGLESIKRISCGYNHCLAVDENLRLWTWGYSESGALGRVSSSRGLWEAPQPVPGLYVNLCSADISRVKSAGRG